MTPILDVANLGIDFGGLQALDDFNIRVYNNEIVGLIGPNGAGKTTVFNLLTSVYQPSRGSIALEGKKPRGKTPIRSPSPVLPAPFRISGCSRTFPFWIMSWWQCTTV